MLNSAPLAPNLGDPRSRFRNLHSATDSVEIEVQYNHQLPHSYYEYLSIIRC